MLQKTPVERVIAAFGSIAEASAATGIPAKRFHAWGAPADQRGADGRIPAKHQGQILHAARRKRIRLAAEDLIDMRHVRNAEDLQ